MDKNNLEFLYVGGVYVRPCGRGIVLDDSDNIDLSDVFQEGQYAAEIHITLRPKNNG